MTYNTVYQLVVSIWIVVLIIFAYPHMLLSWENLKKLRISTSFRFFIPIVAIASFIKKLYNFQAPITYTEIKLQFIATIVAVVLGAIIVLTEKRNLPEIYFFLKNLHNYKE